MLGILKVINYCMTLHHNFTGFIITLLSSWVILAPLPLSVLKHSIITSIYKY